MQKVEIRCWKDTTFCSTGETVEVFFTISDFYEGRRLFIHPDCGAILAVDPDAEYHQEKDFQQLKERLLCPECGKALSDVLPHPDYFRCPSTGTIERYARIEEPPPNRAEVIVKFWDPLT